METVCILMQMSRPACYGIFVLIFDTRKGTLGTKNGVTLLEAKMDVNQANIFKKKKQLAPYCF